MLALLVISIACFFALYFAMLALLRHAAETGRTLLGHQQERSSRPVTNAHDSAAALPALRRKHPDWRFLVRDGRRPFPSGQTAAPTRKPAAASNHGRTRSDWAHYNKDLGDLNDPYQAPPFTARQA